MARIVVSGYGTAGDFVPLVALSEELMSRGHRVLAAVNPWAAPLFSGAGLETSVVGPRFGPEEAAAHQDLFDARLRWTAAREVEAANLTDWPRHYREVARCCRAHDADLLVAGATLHAARWVAEDLRIPWVEVHCSDAASGRPSAVGVPERRRPLTLALASGRLAPREREPVPGRVGFAFPRSVPSAWTEPSPELRAFLGSVGRPGVRRPRRWRDGPVVLLPGSTPLRDPATALRAHVEAAAALNRRLVVHKGWTGFGADMLDPGTSGERVHFADVLPHDWLLRRAAAVVLSGRPGTLARALRAGCPVLVEPRGRDAFANGKKVLDLGVGAVLDPRRASTDSIRRVLDARVMLPEVRLRCARVAKRMEGEDGAAAAADAIESWVEAGATGSP